MAINDFETYSIILISLKNIRTHKTLQVKNNADVLIIPLNKIGDSWAVEIKAQGTKSAKKINVSNQNIKRGALDQLDNLDSDYDYYAILVQNTLNIISKSGKTYKTNGSVTDAFNSSLYYNDLVKPGEPKSKKDIKILGHDLPQVNFGHFIENIYKIIKNEWIGIFGDFNKAAFSVINSILSLDSVPLNLNINSISLFNQNSKYIDIAELKELEFFILKTQTISKDEYFNDISNLESHDFNFMASAPTGNINNAYKHFLDQNFSSSKSIIMTSIMSKGVF